MSADGSAVGPVAATIAERIHLIRGERVLLDVDLAMLYGVTTSNLNKAVQRNADRFPTDFMFQLGPEEAKSLIFQFGISKRVGRGGNRRLSYAFTEQGVAMLSSVLHSARAVAVNIEIMREFVRLRQLLSTHADLARKLETLEQKYDGQFHVVFDAIRQLMTPPPDSDRKRIGFAVD